MKITFDGKKKLDTNPIFELLVQGENMAESIQITGPKKIGLLDLSKLRMTVRVVSEQSETMVEKKLQQSTDDSSITLTWDVDKQFTSVSGHVQVMLIGYGTQGEVIKITSKGIQIKEDKEFIESPPESGWSQLLSEIQSLAAKAENEAAKSKAFADLAKEEAQKARTLIMDKKIQRTSVWSSENTVNQICPGVSAKGAVTVVNNVIPSYPLSVISHISPIQEGTGDPSLNNIRPIKGLTSLKLMQCGENLLNCTVDTKTTSGVTVAKQSDGGYKFKGTNTSSGKIYFDLAPQFMLPAGKYTLSGVKRGTGIYAYIRTQEKPEPKYYNDTGTGVSFELLQSTMCSFTAVVNGNIQTDGQSLSSILVLQSKDVNTYTPYRGKEYTVQFGQTVYGGEFDWKSGKLRATFGFVTYDDVSKNSWKAEVTGNGNVRFGATLPSLGASEPSNRVVMPGVCSCFKLASNAETWNGTKQGISYSGWWIGLNLNGIKTLEEFGPWLKAHPIQLVYQLDKPIEIQLTPQQILALPGTNTLYSDTGDTEVMGKTNVQDFIAAQPKTAPFTIRGFKSSYEQLVKDRPAGEAGEAWAVGTTADYVVWFWDTGTSQWANAGKIKGANGRDGENGPNIINTETAVQGFKNGEVLSVKEGQVVGINIYDLFFPIGYTFEWEPQTEGPDLSTAEKVAAYYGFGTWKASAPGKVIVGIDPNDPDFKTPGKTGGEKKHLLTNRELPAEYNVEYGDSGGGSNMFSGAAILLNGKRRGALGMRLNDSGGGSHNNLQPYVVLYRWTRIG